MMIRQVLARRVPPLHHSPYRSSSLRYLSNHDDGRGGGHGDDDDGGDRKDAAAAAADEWIPPSRPLVGDVGRADLYPRGRPSRSSPTTTTSIDESSDRRDVDLSEIDLSKIDWNELEVEGAEGRGSWGQMVQDSGEGDEDMGIDIDEIMMAGGGGNFDDMIEGSVVDIESYVKRVLAESESGAGLQEDEGEDEDDEDDDDEDEEAERLELELLEEELLRYEREEEEKAAAAVAASASASASAASSNEKSGGGGSGGNTDARSTILSDDPTCFTVDDFIFERAEERLRERSQLEQEQEEDEGDAAASAASASASPDWLASRRNRLAASASAARAVGMLTPTDAAAARELDSEIPPVRHTLLSSTEIMGCVSALGGTDVRLVEPANNPDGTNALGCDGLVIVTGRSSTHLSVLADALVRNLRARGLDERGVVGAMLGPEGGEDRTTSKRNRRRAGGVGGRVDDGWMVVDCGNYVVHLQDEITRRHVNLVGLWADGKEGKDGRELRSVDWTDEEAVDDYVSSHPVPDDYARTMLMQNAVDIVLPQFARKGRGERWNPVKKVKKNRGIRRRF